MRFRLVPKKLLTSDDLGWPTANMHSIAEKIRILEFTEKNK